MNKGIKLLIAAAIASQSFASLSALGANGWEISYSGDKNTDRTKYVANVTEQYKYNGQNSMLVKYPGTVTEGNHVEIKGNLTETLPAGEYTLVFYGKGATSAYTEICIGDKITLGYSGMTKESVPKADTPSGESSWYKYSYDFTCEADEISHIIFRFSGGTASAAIDDVSVFVRGGIENYMPDSGFEGVEEQLPEDEPYDTALYQAKDFIASPGNGKIGLSWINPKTPELTDVELYDITNGEWTLLSDDLSTSASAVVNYPVTGLVNGASYRYALKFEYGSKPAFVYYASAAPTAATVTKLGDNWSFEEFKSGAANYSPVSYILSEDTQDDEGYSIRLRSNIDSSNVADLSGNIYLRFLQNLDMKPNSKYKFFFRAKCEGIENDAVKLLCNWSPFEEFAPSWACSDLNGTKDWSEYSYTYTTGDSVPSYVHFIMDKIGTLYLDDLAMYEIDENGDVTGENLISDGDIDSLYSECAGKIESVDVIDEGLRNVSFAWTAEPSDIAGINFYQKVFDNFEYRGKLDLDNTMLNIEGLTIGTEYTYLLVPYNQMGIEGEGYEFTATTDIPDYELTSPVLYKANSIVKSLSGDGTYTVQTTVKNYKVEGMKYAQCVCVYKDGALLNMYVTDNTLEPQEKNKSAVKINTSFKLDGTEDAVKVFILDSVESMNKLNTTTVYE